MKILIFGGTREAIEFANILGEEGHEIILSLAGRTQNPKLPKYGQVRIGGFGGAEKIAEFLSQENIDLIIDITHPYAQNISNQLVDAASLSQKSLLRFKRPLWHKNNENDWQEFENVAQAIKQLPQNVTCFISTGHKGLEELEKRPDCKFLVRLIEVPKITLPQNCTIILSHPPYEVSDELAVMKQHKITHLLSKNSGSKQTKAKIEAALNLGMDIFMIARPKLKEANELFSTEHLLSYIAK